MFFVDSVAWWCSVMTLTVNFQLCDDDDGDGDRGVLNPTQQLLSVLGVSGLGFRVWGVVSLGLSSFDPHPEGFRPIVGMHHSESCSHLFRNREDPGSPKVQATFVSGLIGLV